jgi:hypothetical protein
VTKPDEAEGGIEPSPFSTFFFVAAALTLLLLRSRRQVARTQERRECRHPESLLPLPPALNFLCGSPVWFPCAGELQALLIKQTKRSAHSTPFNPASIYSPSLSLLPSLPLSLYPPLSFPRLLLSPSLPRSLSLPACLARVQIQDGEREDDSLFWFGALFEFGLGLTAM